MNNPLISVLIANYNNGKYLKEAIESIYKQTYKNWEIIIVDDCSTDTSFSIYREIAEHPQIRIYYNEKNKGCGYTKRRCVEEASGSICGFLDPDDIISEEALELMVDSHRKYPKCSIIHSKLYFCDENLQIIGEYSTAKDVHPEQSTFFNMQGEITHFATFKKDFYSKTEGIDSYLIRAVDQDLYFKLYEVGETFFLNKFLYYYRVHSSGISTFDNSDKAYYWKWFTILNAAKRRNINVEDFFLEHFVTRSEFESLKSNYDRLKKYDKLNTFLKKVRHIFKSKE